MNIFTLYLWFMIYSFLGWLYESMLYTVDRKKFVNRGFLNGPYCPIYGAGAVLFILTTNGIENFFLRFLAGGLIACLLEYITSYTLEKLFHARWWDYTPRRFNIKGRVCLIGFVVFGAFAVFMPWIHHFIAGITNQLSWPATVIIALLLATIFITDIAITNAGLVRFNKVLKEYQKAIDRHYLHALEFIRRGKRTFEMHIAGTRKHFKHVLDLQQRRTIEAFPYFISTRYNEALEHLRELNADSRLKIIARRQERKQSRRRGSEQPHEPNSKVRENHRKSGRKSGRKRRK